MNETMQPKKRDRRVLVAGELTDDERELIAQAEVPEKHAHLDAELRGWLPDRR